VHNAGSSVEGSRVVPEAAPVPDPGPAQPTRAAGGDRIHRLVRPAGRLLGRVPRRWRLPLATFLACQAIFLFWWAAFYPALMSYDSAAYVLQVTAGPWVNNYSVLYDALVWLTLHLTGGLAALALVQTVAMSASFGYTVIAFRRIGVPGRWTAVAAVVATALPTTGTFIIFIWKDVGFVICLYLVVPTVAHLISLRDSPDWRRDRRINRLIAALGLELLGVMLFRLNGFLIVAIAAVLLLIVLPGIRLRLTAAVAAAACVTYALTFFVYPAVGIQKTAAWEAYSIQYADIAVAYADRPYSFTAADLRLMAQAAPLTKWKNSADCYDSDTTTSILDASAHSEPVSGQLIGLWLRILKRSPDLILNARLCRGSIAWSIFDSVGLDAQTVGDPVIIDPGLWGLAYRPGVAGNPYRDAMRTRPLSTKLNHAGLFLRSLSDTPQLDWILWRAPFWCYLSYLAVWLFARRRRNWKLLALGAIVAGAQLGVLADVPDQLFRYMAGPIFIGIMLVPLLFAGNRPAPPGASPPAGSPPTGS
jgi:Family of unknown function (DUF6020)